MIYQWETGGGDPQQVVADFFDRFAAESPRPVDPFAERLFLGVASTTEQLDEIIRRHVTSRWAPERIAPIVRHLLRLAISELRAGDTPARIVIDEALEIGKRYDGDGSTPFLNGILEASRAELAQQRKAEKASGG